MAQVQQVLESDSHHDGHRIGVTIHVLGHPIQAFEASSEAVLLEVMERAAGLTGVALLPPRKNPFDHLREMNGEQLGAIIENLDQTLGDYLRYTGHSPHFAIELVRSFHVNTRWDVAAEKVMSPRQILALPRIHLDFTKYSLYLPDSTEELALDTPIEIERGTDLEAQADGKYGWGL